MSNNAGASSISRENSPATTARLSSIGSRATPQALLSARCLSLSPISHLPAHASPRRRLPQPCTDHVDAIWKCEGLGEQGKTGRGLATLLYALRSDSPDRLAHGPPGAEGWAGSTVATPLRQCVRAVLRSDSASVADAHNLTATAPDARPSGFWERTSEIRMPSALEKQRMAIQRLAIHPTRPSSADVTDRDSVTFDRLII
jgi:hypothetical protein